MKSSRHAFSLIEVLVTFVIIAFACAIGIQGVTQLRDNARRQTMLTRIKQLDIAKEQFIAEYGRAEAESIWTNPQQPPSPPAYTPYTTLASYPAGDSDQNEYRYAYLKRYIERPSYYLADVSPDSACSVFTPTNVHGTYSGAVTLLGNNSTKIGITDH